MWFRERTVTLTVFVLCEALDRTWRSGWISLKNDQSCIFRWVLGRTSTSTRMIRDHKSGGNKKSFRSTYVINVGSDKRDTDEDVNQIPKCCHSVHQTAHWPQKTVQPNTTNWTANWIDLKLNLNNCSSPTHWVRFRDVRNETTEKIWIRAAPPKKRN